ncbi:MAG TPA: NDP-sugar synthase [Dehalococcoidia bacterium]|nr:NDP-sugar synthase [Dehalococcoidia bacterium]
MTNAVILVGGGGTRLRPLTYAVPKPLIPVLNRPLISHLVDHLRRHGVNRIVLAASANDKRIEAALGDGSALGISLSYCYETEPLGSGLAVKQAARDFDGPFFVCNGDVITNLDLRAMAERHRANGALLSISLAYVDDPSGFGVVELDEGDRIARFVEKPAPGEAPSSWANAGTWIFEPEVLHHIADEKMDGSLERLVFPSLIADGFRVQGFPSAAYWMDVGTSERYMRLHRDILAGRLDTLAPDDIEARPYLGHGCRVWPDATLLAPVVLGERCRVGAGVRIEGPSVLGDDCAIREEARVAASVLWSGVRVGAGAFVRDSIVGEGCWIGDGAVVEGAVLANGAKVKRGVRLVPGARLEPDEVAG